MNKTIYISGKITGLPELDAQIKFSNAEYDIEKKFGILNKIINPIEVCRKIKNNSPWETYMKRCLQHLVKADTIYMLPCWKQSRGAQIELQMAVAMGLEIIFAPEQ